MRVVGGREIHPINVRVGGFYRAPTRARAAPRGRAARARARVRAARPSRWTAALPFPDFEEDYEFVALRDPDALPDRARAPRLERRPRPRAVASTRSTSSRSTSRTRPRCTRACATAARYLVGPLARYALNRDRLSPLAREAADAARPRSRSCRNPFRSIVVRAVEILYALDEALRLIDGLRAARPAGASRSLPRAGVGLRLDRGAARHALAPLRDRRRRHDPRREDRAAHLAEPGTHRAEPARLRRSSTSTSTTTSCACAASRRSATTTPASRARRTSCASRSTAA